MCIKIICSDHEHEFDTSFPLEAQIVGAKEILIDFDPLDEKIDFFVDKIEKMAYNGASCQVNIKVNPNNCLDGIRLERIVDGIKRKLDVNEVIKSLTTFHAETDSKLRELSEICTGKN